MTGNLRKVSFSRRVGCFFLGDNLFAFSFERNSGGKRRNFIKCAGAKVFFNIMVGRLSCLYIGACISTGVLFSGRVRDLSDTSRLERGVLSRPSCFRGEKGLFRVVGSSSF